MYLSICCLKKKLKILRWVAETCYVFSLRGRKSFTAKTGELYWVSEWTSTVLPTNNPLSCSWKSTNWNVNLNWLHRGDICIAYAHGLNAKIPFSLRRWCHSSLWGPSHRAPVREMLAVLSMYNLQVPKVTSGYLKIILCVHIKGWQKHFGKAALDSQISEGSSCFLVSSSVFVIHLKSVFLWTILKIQMEPTETVRFVRGPLDGVFLPGQWWRAHWGQVIVGGGGGGLSEELPDLSVNVAKEVHVGSATVQAFILHQELTEQHLWFVLLPHDLELHRVRPLFKQAADDGSDLFGQRVV